MTTVIPCLFTLIFWALVIMALEHLSIRRHSNRLAMAADALGCGWFALFAVTLAILILNWE